MNFKPLLARLAPGITIAGAAGMAAAQDKWPMRPIRIVVPFSPAGGGDAVVRALTEQIGSGFEPAGNTPEEFEWQIKADLTRWNEVVKGANLRVD